MQASTLIFKNIVHGKKPYQLVGSKVLVLEKIIGVIIEFIIFGTFSFSKFSFASSIKKYLRAAINYTKAAIICGAFDCTIFENRAKKKVHLNI